MRWHDEIPFGGGFSAAFLLHKLNAAFLRSGSLMENNYSFDNPILYTTGAYIQPLKVVDVDGTEKWFWAVSEFVDDTFWDGEVFNPGESGTTKQNLLLE